MVDRALKIYQGEDLSPITDLTGDAADAEIAVIWESAEFGQRAYRGEATNSNITLRDERAQTGNRANLPAGLSGISLAAGNTVEFTHGSNVLFRQRLATKDYSRGEQRAGRYREVAAYLEDINIDLRGIVVHGFQRPSETDVARAQALVARYLSGGADGRPSTIVNGSNLVNAGSNTVTLPAKTYTKTDVQSVLVEIADAANKTFYLLPRRRTTDTHTAELFYDGNDAVMETCPYKISDRPDEVAASPDHVFFPIWNVGPAATENGQELISGVWLFYGSDDASYVHVHDDTQANLYIKREIVVYDDTVSSQAEATRRANAILFFRKYEERTINVSIGPLTDAHVGSIRAGQTISIKAMPIAFADDQYYDGKISQFKLSTYAPGRYFAHLQIDRPWRMDAYGKGLPVGPKPPSPGSPGTSLRLYFMSDEAGEPDHGHGAPDAPAGFTDDPGWDSVSSGETYMLYTEPETTGPTANTPFSGSFAANTDIRQNQYLYPLSGDLLAVIQAGGATVRMQARANSRFGIGISEASQDIVSQLSIRVIASDGTVRGTALAMHSLTTSLGAARWAPQATPVNRVFPPATATNTLTAVASAQEGDYLVVEPGGRTFYTGVTGGAVQPESGKASDLPEDESTTDNLNSWIEFTTDATAGDLPSATVGQGEGSVGTDTDHYAPLDHQHEHGLLSDDEDNDHQATQVDYDPTASGMDATNVQDAFDEIGRLNNWTATTAPTVNDDTDDGYKVGSRWIDVTNDKEYVCVDASSSAAVWKETTGGGSALTVEEADGTPTDSAVTKIVFPNGTLDITSHVATYTPASSGGGTGAYDELIGDGSSTSIQVTHNLGTEAVQVALIKQSDGTVATGDATSITVDDEDNVTIVFGSAPATDAYRVVVLASGASGVKAARVTRTAALNVTATPAMVSWDNEVRDDGGFWASSPNPTRLTAPEDGWYDLGANVEHTNSNNNYMFADIYLDGTAAIANAFMASFTDNLPIRFNLSTSIYLTAGQYVELRLVSQATQALTVGATLNMWMAKR